MFLSSKIFSIFLFNLCIASSVAPQEHGTRTSTDNEANAAKAIKNLFFLLCIISTLLISNLAYSCKIVRPDLSKYISGEIPKGVIFIGKAITIKENPAKNGESRLEAIFQVKKGYLGKIENKVLVIGNKGGMKGTSCEGAFDFRATTGQTWVIVGEIKQNGIVLPNVHLSRTLTEQKIPESLDDLKKLIFQ